jgi:hypothetical protein
MAMHPLNQLRFCDHPSTVNPGIPYFLSALVHGRHQTGMITPKL